MSVLANAVPVEVYKLAVLSHEAPDLQALHALLHRALFDWVALTADYDWFRGLLQKFPEGGPHYRLVALILSVLSFNVGLEAEMLQFAIESADCVLEMINIHNRVSGLKECLLPAEAEGWARSRPYVDQIILSVLSNYLESEDVSPLVRDLTLRLIAVEEVTQNLNLFGLLLTKRNMALLEKLLRGDRAFFYLRYLVEHSDFIFDDAESCRAIFALAVECYGVPIEKLAERLVAADYPVLRAWVVLLALSRSSARLAETLLRVFRAHREWALQLSFEVHHCAAPDVARAVVDAFGAAGAAEDRAAEQAEEQAARAAVLRALSGSLQAECIAAAAKNAFSAAPDKLFDFLKNSIGVKPALLQTLVVVAHSFARAGSGSRAWVGENARWLNKTMMWNRFTSVASFGVLARSDAESRTKFLGPYLEAPSGNNGEDGYSLGGAYLAHGFASASAKQPADTELLVQVLSAERSLSKSFDEPVKYFGALLGLGVMNVGCCSISFAELAFNVLDEQDCVASEAAALCVGMLFYQSASEEVVERLQESLVFSAHERIKRGCAVAIAMVLANAQERALAFCDANCGVPEVYLRYAAALVLGTSYNQSARPEALERLLLTCIKEDADDVKHAAVVSIALVFVGSGELECALDSFRLLIDSFNYRIRYAAALGIGIVAAGTGERAASELLMVAINDSHDLVKKAVLSALGMVFMGVSDKFAKTAAPMNGVSVDIGTFTSLKLSVYPTPSELRNQLVSLAVLSYDELMVRAGALFGLGLLYAGAAGQTLRSVYRVPAAEPADDLFPRLENFEARTARRLSAEAQVGFLLYSQEWFWHSYALFAALAFRATAVFGVTAEGVAPPELEFVAPSDVREFAQLTPFKPVLNNSVSAIAKTFLSAAKRVGINIKSVVLEDERAEGAAPEPEPEPLADALAEPAAEAPQLALRNGAACTDELLAAGLRLSGAFRSDFAPAPDVRFVVVRREPRAESAPAPAAR